jgi:hypothetical protein
MGCMHGHMVLVVQMQSKNILVGLVIWCHMYISTLSDCLCTYRVAFQGFCAIAKDGQSGRVALATGCRCAKHKGYGCSSSRAPSTFTLLPKTAKNRSFSNSGKP